MNKVNIFSGLFVLAAVGLGVLFAQGNAQGDTMKGGKDTIRIVEKAGYFETHGNIFNRDAGPVVFEVQNDSGKDAGFVLARTGKDPLVITIENGKNGTLKTVLEPGEYEYYCPIIPTAKYPLSVK